ncbi:serine/threonine protein kinase [Prosthecobacter fusiformis]|uniref:Serine/threonine protein kinase n=1 Tax=Prosthecobacter fusiformis TaxID=48464 RepID=A0A4V3FG20_9BACT|nr:protein kinase [Prosthecobacter fusiformis]TDU72873.1 serine/threonine protein kinase [Prosthecobacter fusiformis]
MNERYHIISTLASGGSGSIQQAWDRTENRDVAIKRLNHLNTAHQAALVREARTLYALRHPYIVTVYDYGSDDQGAYLVMELIKGESLDKRLSRGPLDLAAFKLLVTQTLEAVGAAHDAGLIHRDLKPENIMLPWNQHGHLEVKLIDFGLAQELPADGGLQDSMAGSIYFMAPEQFGSGYVDVRTDLYALGCVYYFALTGQLPFPGEEKAQVITSHLYPPRQPLGELRPDLSDALCLWVEQLIRVKPTDRPPSAAAALAAFRRLGTNLQVQAATSVTEAAVMVLEDEELPAVLPDDEPDEEPVLLTLDEEETSVLSVLADEPETSPEPPVTTVYGEEEESPMVDVSSEPETSSALEPKSFRTEEPALLPAAVSATHAEPAKPTSRAETARRPAQASMRPGTKRRSSLVMIFTAFGFVLLAQLAIVSYFKYAGREAREQRLLQLSESDQPEGSDVDIRMLLEFLQDPAHQDQAAKALTQIRGGSYIDDILSEHLEEIKNHRAAARLVQITGQRRSIAAVEPLLRMTNDPRTDVREAVWLALGRITPEEKLPQVLAQARKSSGSDLKMVEQSLIAAIRGALDPKVATQHVLRAYRQSTGQAENRTLFFNVLTHVGGDETLDIVTEAIADPSQKLRLAAITTLAQYPTHEPLAIITTRFLKEEDEACRIYLLLAARELVGNPGPSSQQTLFLQVQSLYSNTRDTEEKRYVAGIMSRVIAPGTAAFFEEFANEADDSLKAEARDLAEIFRNKLTQVLPVAPNGTAQLPAEKADYRSDSSIALEKDILINWTQEGDWASWLVEFPQSGPYEIAIYQSHTSDQLGTYEVLLAGQTLLTAAVKTGGASDFKGFVVGNVQVEQPGIYRLRVRAKTIPHEGELFRVQKMVVKALPK